VSEIKGTRSLPRPAVRDDESAPFFDALADGVLLVRCCQLCGHVSRPDAHTCSACRSDELSWLESSGNGHVICSVVDRNSAEGPITLALIEVSEGPWFMTRILDADIDATVPAATPVRLAVIATSGGEAIPAFVRDWQSPK
jgi:hypothetical protein